MEKEGLQCAVDFTKYLLALASAAITFIVQPTFYGTDTTLRYMGTASVCFLIVCVLSGLAVFSRSAVMLANRNYSLEDGYVKYPGIINIISFGIGFLLLSVAVALKIWA